MLILLPPSEGKTPAPAGNAPVSFADLSFPELTAERESVLEELTAVSLGPDALAELKVGASLEAEVERNTRLLTEPAQPAIRTYTGVLFEARRGPLVTTDFFGAVGYSAPRGCNSRLPPVNGGEAGFDWRARILLERRVEHCAGGYRKGPADSGLPLLGVREVVGDSPVADSGGARGARCG